ncbi:MAG: hypothetical protein US11_C0002G0048 [Candidatus Roizmanbacteria bacterium GW2011_GWA2_36_23]|uniref:Uncharacterized protein n=1 Tax=Candidatus Roizmanbacteria bacterium GW2011_GWA2_36_23 TaxID=1618480 RepID=A0A0G0GQA9_9BACT|nr:MAG: hypothetical protein US11_C0002G0048 [Candidatus Roizmanbacteria bacterium GW2011_GWA2_36_23]
MDKQKNDSNLIHSFDDSMSAEGMPTIRFFSYIGLALLLGIIVGFSVSKITSGKATSQDKINMAKSAGVTGKKNFKDSTEGILKEGGIEGEGNFHLQRPGGVSQNVYLTSTTVDLSQYVNKKVKVWGETFSGEKAGWLMDVGLVELL